MSDNQNAVSDLIDDPWMGGEPPVAEHLPGDEVDTSEPGNDGVLIEHPASPGTRISREDESGQEDPEAEPVPPVIATAQQENSPATAEVAPTEEIPTEWNGWALSPDATDLYEPALEDTQSQEAEQLIEQIGEREYMALLLRYNRDKIAYSRDVEARENQALQTGVEALTTEIQQVDTKMREWLTPVAEREGGSALVETLMQKFSQEAQGIVAATRDAMVEDLVRRGVPQHIAYRRATATVLNDRGLYEDAMGRALLADFPSFMKSIFSAPPPKTPPTNQTRPPAPQVGTRAALRNAPPPVRVSPGEAEIARQLGYTPEEFAAKRARLT